MRYKKLLLVFPLIPAMAAMPATAQDDVVFVSGTGPADAAYDAASEDDFAYSDTSAGMADMADRISDPVNQDRVAAIVEAMSHSFMHIPVGGFAEAIERARPGTVKRRVRSDATVGDLAGPDARYLPAELGDRSREAMGMMGGFARAFAHMMPEFERVGREMEESFRVAKEEARRGRD